MRRLIICACACAALLGTTGCELFSNQDDYGSLSFENASHFEIQVYPLTTQWSAFTLAPGQRVEIGDVRDTDFYFKPEDRVQEAAASGEREVIFVDAVPEK